MSWKKIIKSNWLGDVKDKDDFGVGIKDIFIDGRTIMGPWAIMTPESFENYGVGLGMGQGQKYKLQENGDWLKVEG